MTSATPSKTDAPQPNRRGAFFMLFFALMAIGAGNTMLIAAVLPPMTRELGMPDWMAGAVFALSALCFSASSPFWGKQSNVMGRRPIAAMGLFGYAISMMLLLVAGWLALSGRISGIWLIFVLFASARCIFGLFGSGVSPAAQAYVADRTTQDERQSEIALVSSGWSVGTVIGPAIAAALVASFGLLSPVLLTAILAVAMSVFIYKFLPENRPPVSNAKKVRDGPVAKGLWRHKNVLPFLIFAVMLSLVTGILTQVFVFTVMDRLGVTGTEAAQYTGPAFTVGAMAVLTAQLGLIPRLKLKNKTLMIFGCIPLIMGAGLLIFANTFASLVLAQFFVGLGQGLTRPGFSSGASLAVSPELQGDVAGLVISANGMGFIVTPFFGLFLYEYLHPQIPFVICVCLLIFMLLYARFALGKGVGEVQE